MTDQSNTRGQAGAEHAAEGASARDTALLVAAVALLLGGLVAYYAFAQWPIAARIAVVVGGLVLAIGAFAVSAHGRQLWQFVLGSRVELRKMVWPTLPETRTITLIVFVFVAVLGVFFWVIDWVLAWGTRHLLGGGA